MATMSIGTAVGAGFNLVGRRLLSVLAWGFFLYFSILALFAIGVAIVGLSVFQHLPAFSGPPDPAQIQQAAISFLIALAPALLLAMVGGLFIGAMVQGAVYRSILTPDQKSWASLRLGRRELALVLLSFVIFFFVLLAYLASILIVGGAIFLATRIHGFVGPLLAFVFCIFYALALLWLALRFSLAAPMTFAEGRVRFFGSWGLTRGHGWAMFGLFWVMLLVIVGVSIGYSIVASIINAVFLGGAVVAIGASPGASTDPSVIMSHLPVLLMAYIPSLLLGAAFQGVMQAIAQGPWAEAYRELAGPPDVSATFS